MTIFWILLNSISSKNSKNKTAEVETTSTKMQLHDHHHGDFGCVLNQSELYEHRRDANQFTVDCSKSTTGLFFGIFILLLTIISLIMYFIYKKHYPLYAEVITGVSELGLICLSIIVVITSWIKLKYHKFRHMVRELEISISLKIHFKYFKSKG